MIIGYTNGYFDLFHVGHLNLLHRASRLCDKLIVGVISDEECQKCKGVKPIIPLHQRIKIVESIYRVGLVVPVFKDHKEIEWDKYKFQILFVGTDHMNTHVWKSWESCFSDKHVKIIYLPYTKEISTTQIKERILCQSSGKSQ